MKVQDLLVLALLVIALIVLTGLSLGMNVWPAIICYWAVLSVKNFLDCMERRR